MTGPDLSHEEVLRARELKNGEDILVVDVRERLERAICRIDGSVAIPLGELPQRLSEIDSSKRIVTQCHTGVRSLHALQVLRAAGFADVRNLEGGIEAWALEIDPEMPRY